MKHERLKRSPGRRRRDLPGLVLLLILSSAVAASAQQTPASDTAGDTFFDALDIRVIEVEVVVTDRDGHRVPNLGAEDFRLLIDGRPVPIDYFGERWDGIATVEDREATTVEGNSYLVFIDDYFTDRRFREALFVKLLADLDNLGPSDLMAVLRYRGLRLEVLSGWTSAKSDLRRVLDEARSENSREQVRLNRLRANPSGINQVLAWEQQIRKVTSCVAAGMRSMARVPGRKVLVLISTGWPYWLGTSDDNAVRVEISRRGGIRLLRPVTDTANLLGYTIYPLHLGLIQGGQHRANAANRSPTAPPLGETWNLGSLDFLAAETGGELFAYAAVVEKPFERVVADTRSYYSLGFTPTWQANNQPHRIRVVPSERDLEVRHRRGYVDLSRGAMASMNAEAALLIGPSGPLLDIVLGRPQRKGLTTVEVPLEVRIPMDWVAMVPVRGGYGARLELRVATIDAEGDRSEMPIIPVNIVGPRPQPGSHAVYATRIKIRRRPQEVLVDLHDTLSGQSLATTVELDKGRARGS